MKISEMTNEQAAEALIRLSVPFGNICDDEEALKLIDQYNKMRKIPMIQMIGKILPQLTGYLLKTHKEDLYEIVGALTMQKASAIAKMNFFETIKIIKGSYDEVLRDFFTSSAQQVIDTAESLPLSSANTDTTE